MSAERVHRTTHETTVAAPAGVVYGLIADSLRRPVCFPPTVHLEQLEFDGSSERLRIWATANGRVKSWTSRRSLDAVRRRIEFRQEVTAAPVQSMKGAWTVESLDAGNSRLVLLHDFTVAYDNADDVAWVERAVDTNSRAELAALRRLAEHWSQLEDLMFSFEDSVRVNGPAELVHDFLYRVGDWPELLPHVSRLDLTEAEPGIQAVSMDTLAPDGTAHTVECVRLCFPHAGRIVHKQTSASPLIRAHTGEWSVVPDERGVTVVSQHTVVLDPEGIHRVLGENADAAQARHHVREALGRHSTATLALAKQHAESAVTVL